MTQSQVLKRDTLVPEGQAMLFAPPRPQIPQPKTEATASVSSPSTSDPDQIRLELEAMKKRATEDGRQEGLKSAQTQIARASSQQVEQLRALVESLRQAVAQARDRQESLMADIVMVAVRRMLGDAFASPDAALAAVRSTLEEASLKKAATLEVHPSDLPYLQQAVLSGDLEALAIVASREVEVGGCRLLTPEGVLDARLETQLSLLRSTLDQARTSWSSQAA